MSSFFRDKAAEWSQLFAGILTFGLLGRWQFLPTDYLGGELVKLVVDLVVAFTVVFIVCEIFLGRPTLQFEWRQNSRDRPLAGEIIVRTQKQAFNLQVTAKGGTALQRYLLRRSISGQLNLEVKIVPEGLVRLSKQGGTAHFRCRPDKRSLMFDGIELDNERTVCTADFTLKRVGRMDYTQPVDIRLSACWMPKLGRTSLKLTKLESAVDRFVLEGISSGSTNHGANQP